MPTGRRSRCGRCAAPRSRPPRLRNCSCSRAWSARCTAGAAARPMTCCGRWRAWCARSRWSAPSRWPWPENSAPIAAAAYPSLAVSPVSRQLSANLRAGGTSVGASRSPQTVNQMNRPLPKRNPARRARLAVVALLALPLALPPVPATARPPEAAPDPTADARHLLAEHLAQLGQSIVATRAITPETLDQSIALLRGALRLNPDEPRFARLLAEAADRKSTRL